HPRPGCRHTGPATAELPALVNTSIAAPRELLVYAHHAVASPANARSMPGIYATQLAIADGAAAPGGPTGHTRGRPVRSWQPAAQRRSAGRFRRYLSSGLIKGRAQDGR